MRGRALKLPGPSRGLRIGLFGGSFNPAHDGHVHVAETAMKRLQLDYIWWIVARGNPLKESHGSYAARIASARRLVDHPRMRVTDLEEQLGVNYTKDLLEALGQRTKGANFVWIMGADNLAGFHKWGGWKMIAQTVPICVIARPGSGSKARLAKFANTYRSARIDPTDGPLLCHLKAPAWIYLTAPWHPASSTALRKAARIRNPFRSTSQT